MFQQQITDIHLWENNSQKTSKLFERPLEKAAFLFVVDNQVIRFYFRKNCDFHRQSTFFSEKLVIINKFHLNLFAISLALNKLCDMAN